MAIINKINEKSGIVVGVIAVGLLLFLLSDAIFGPNSLFNSRSTDVGKIDGEKIPYDQYRKTIQKVEMDYVIRSGRNITENERTYIQDQAWNELIFQTAWQEQFNKLGIEVTEEEIEDMIQGKNVHPLVKQLFTNPQTGQFDKNFMRNFLKDLDKRAPRDQALWLNVRNSLAPDRLRNKYLNLFKKAVYVTKAEAERDYQAQNQKASLKYLFVPYYTMPDSTIQISESELEEYISKHKAEYKVQEGRSIDYVSFSIAPSKEDTLAIEKDIKEVAKEFAAAEGDSAFISLNSDNPTPIAYKHLDELPVELQQKYTTIKKDSIYGPINQFGKFFLYKVLDVKEDPKDSNYVARASHILFRAKSETPADKELAKKDAEKVLAEIKVGASFDEMARLHGTDGTASKGGDLGFFSKGKMVKPFEEAVFAANAPGVLPRLTETQFGYHIIKVTIPKTNKQFKLAEVSRDVVASEETKDAAYKKASDFAAAIEDTTSFNEMAKKDTLVKSSAKNIGKNERNINNLMNAREIVKWAYEAKVNTVSQVFTLDNQYVIAALTSKREEGTAEVKDVKEEVTAKVRNEKKAEKILEKLNASKGQDLDKMAAAYGKEALTGNADNVAFSAYYIQGIGSEPVAIGKAFALKNGEKTEPFKGETGVIALQLVSKTEAPAIADYSIYKTQLAQQRSGQIDYKIDEAIKKNADIKDERYRFY